MSSPTERIGMSRESLLETYISALPFTAVAVVPIDGGGCRIETGAPGETIERLYYFKPSHVDLVLDAAGLADGPIDQPPDAVATLIERTAVAMGAPFETAAEIRAAAKQEVDKIIDRVEAMRQNGGIKEINARYKAYRLAQMAKAEKAMPYGKFIERFTAVMVRDVAMTGRVI
jgi:hypothetical protein